MKRINLMLSLTFFGLGLLFVNDSLAMMDKNNSIEDKRRFPVGQHIKLSDDLNKGRVLNEEALATGQEEAGNPHYVPGEVLVKFKEGVDPQAVLRALSIDPKGIERVHSIASVAANFKKDYKLEKDSDGWYWFMGKQYKETSQIPDEEAFKAACQNMSSERQGLYRNYKIKLSDDVSVEEAVSQLRSDPNIEYAYPNYIRKVSAVPNDPKYANQWALPKIKATQAWAITAGNPNVVIAVIDTGVDYNHEDLAANIWINSDEIANNGIDDDHNGYIDDVRGYDFVSAAPGRVSANEDPGPADNNPMDVNGHGTHLAGIIAAVKNNGKGISGIAPGCKIMAVRAGYNTPDGAGALEDADIEKAILYAVDNGARIINMSFGGYGQGAFIDELRMAYSENVVLVAAAGNENTSYQFFPASMDEVIAVAATDQKDTKASFSNYGDWVDVSAPGVSILSTLPNNQYAAWDGTSMATPYVAGIAGLMLSINPSMNNKDVCEAMQIAFDDLGLPGKDGNFGYGRANAFLAVKAVKGVALSMTSPIASSFVKGNIDISGSAWIKEGFKKYEIYWAPRSKPNNLTLIASSTQPVENGFLARLDTNRCLEGENLLILKVFSASGDIFQRTVHVLVDNINQPPEFNLTNKGVVIGQSLNFKVNASDPDDPAAPWGKLTYSAANLPPNARFFEGTQMFFWNPSTAEKGCYKVTFTVKDSGYTVNREIMISTIYVEKTLIAGTNISEYRPRIEGNRVVYYDNPYHRNSNIYLYDIKSQATTLLANSVNVEYFINQPGPEPDISADRVVWSDFRNGGRYDIFMYDLRTGVERQITNADDGRSPINPAIDADKIVYSYTNWYDDMGIFVYNLSTSKQKTIITNTSIEGRPFIAGNKIVWDDGHSGNRNIYMYDCSNGSTRALTTDSGDQLSPYIYKDRVVWIDRKDDGNGDICMFDLANPSKGVIRLTDSLSEKYNPVFFGDKIAWVDWREAAAGQQNIYLYDISTETETKINDDDAKFVYLFSPDIYENKVAWDSWDFQRRNADIFLSMLYFAPTISSVRPSSSGDKITIIGKNFGYTQEDGQVQFDDGTMCAIQRWSNEEIVCAPPQLAKRGLLKVVTKGGESNAVRVNYIPTIVSFTPVTGPFKINYNWTFKAVYSDLNGFADLDKMYLLINTSIASANAFYVYYNRSENKLYLYNGSKWLGGYAPGSSNIIDGPYGKIDCANTSVSGSGNNLTVNWKLSFKSTFTGTKNIYLSAFDTSAADTNYQQKGSIVISK